MPVGTVTFTGKIGPGNQLTSKLFSRVRAVNLDLEDGVMEVIQASDNPQGNTVTQLELAGITTLTDTITAGVHAIVAS